MSAVEALAGGGATEGDHVPVEQAGVAFQLDAGAQLGLGAGVDDGLLRQPFGGTGSHAQLTHWRALPAARYHLAAPGLVSWVQARSPTSTAMSGCRRRQCRPAGAR